MQWGFLSPPNPTPLTLWNILPCIWGLSSQSIQPSPVSDNQLQLRLNLRPFSRMWISEEGGSFLWLILNRWQRCEETTAGRWRSCKLNSSLEDSGNYLEITRIKTCAAQMIAHIEPTRQQGGNWCQIEAWTEFGFWEEMIFFKIPHTHYTQCLVYLWIELWSSHRLAFVNRVFSSGSIPLLLSQWSRAASERS